MKSNLFPLNSCIELYNASSPNILKLWKMKGKIEKEFDIYSKAYIHILFEGGKSIMTIPSKEKQSLQLQNYFLLFQFILINPEGFNIELSLRDTNNNKRKIIFNNNISESIMGKILINNYPINIWTNLLIDLYSLFNQIYQNCQLKYIDNILITGNLKIRKIYSLKSKEEILPRSIELAKYLNAQSYFLYDYHLSLVKINLKVSERANSKDKASRNNTPIKNGKKLSPLRIENKNNIYLINQKEKMKRNMQFVKNIPDLKRVKYEINYKLKLKPNEIGQLRNINKLLLLNNIENMETYNNSKTPIKYANHNRENSSKKKQRSSEKFHNYKDIILNNNKDKAIIPIKRNNYNKKNSGRYRESATTDNKININKIKLFNNEKKVINENNIDKIDDINNDNKINDNNNNSNIVFHNDTLYNFLDNKNNSNIPRYVSYGVQAQSTANDNIRNLNNKYELKLPKIGINGNNIKLPKIKNSYQKQDLKYKDKNNENNISKSKDSNILNNNKYTNFDIILDSMVINNNKIQAQLYDSIEEEYLINNNIESTLFDREKIDDRIIRIDPVIPKRNNNNEKNKNELMLSNEYPELSNLINDDLNNPDRPYTPPLSKLVPVNQSRNFGGKNNKIILKEKNDLKNSKINPNIISYKKSLGNSENLLYDEIKGRYYNPKTNVYYDIKNLF